MENDAGEIMTLQLGRELWNRVRYSLPHLTCKKHQEAPESLLDYSLEKTLYECSPEKLDVMQAEPTCDELPSWLVEAELQLETAVMQGREALEVTEDELPSWLAEAQLRIEEEREETAAIEEAGLLRHALEAKAAEAAVEAEIERRVQEAVVAAKEEAAQQVQDALKEKAAAAEKEMARRLQEAVATVEAETTRRVQEEAQEIIAAKEVEMRKRATEAAMAEAEMARRIQEAVALTVVVKKDAEASRRAQDAAKATVAQKETDAAKRAQEVARKVHKAVGWHNAAEYLTQAKKTPPLRQLDDTAASGTKDRHRKERQPTSATDTKLLTAKMDQQLSALVNRPSPSSKPAAAHSVVAVQPNQTRPRQSQICTESLGNGTTLGEQRQQRPTPESSPVVLSAADLAVLDPLAWQGAPSPPVQPPVAPPPCEPMPEFPSAFSSTSFLIPPVTQMHTGSEAIASGSTHSSSSLANSAIVRGTQWATLPAADELPQLMAMFPHLDRDVIIAVLRSTATTEAAVDRLLHLSSTASAGQLKGATSSAAPVEAHATTTAASVRPSKSTAWLLARESTEKMPVTFHKRWYGSGPRIARA